MARSQAASSQRPDEPRSPEASLANLCRRLVVYTDATERGGAERVLAYLISELDARIEVTVMGVEPGVVAWIAEQRQDAAQLIVPPVRNKWHAQAVMAHLRAVRRLKPDVLHASLHSPWSCHYGILAGLLAPGTKVVAVENALVTSTSRVQLHIKRLVSRRLDAHVAVGNWSARATEREVGLPHRSIITIPNGVPDLGSPPRRSRSGAAETVLGTVARIAPQKGIDLIVRALPELPDARAKLVGDGPSLVDIQALAQELGVEHRVEAKGFDPEARRQLSDFDVFVLPTHAEACPLAIIEAMLSGLPVVTTNIPSIVEMFPDGEVGVLIAPDDLNGLVEALRMLIRDSKAREEMGARARSYALEKFSVAAMARAYERLYREILAAAPRLPPSAARRSWQGVLR